MKKGSIAAALAASAAVTVTMVAVVVKEVALENPVIELHYLICHCFKICKYLNFQCFDE